MLSKRTKEDKNNSLNVYRPTHVFFSFDPCFNLNHDVIKTLDHLSKRNRHKSINLIDSQCRILQSKHVTFQKKLMTSIFFVDSHYI